MNDYSDLVKRLREHAENMYVDFLNEAADAIEAKDGEIDFWKNRTREALQMVRENIERIAELEAALKPFADASDLHMGSDDMSIAFRIIIGNLRQASKVLGKKKDNFTEREI